MCAGKYSDDLDLLKSHTEIIELSTGWAKLAVAPAWQGRVMNSTLTGSRGAGFGWINRSFIESRKDDPVFNNYGGEDRFWLGPEAGQFGLWFDKGQPFELSTWRTPAGVNSVPFAVTRSSKKALTLTSRSQVANCSGTNFDYSVERTISLLGAEQAPDHLGATVPAGLKMVAFESRNTLTNAGTAPWTRQGGLLSIWILGMFRPVPRGKVIVPFVPGDDPALGKKATTDYFGQVPADRCRVAADHVVFSCDGVYRSKIGISPARSVRVLGSYDPDAKVLTVVQYNLPVGASKLPYVNSLWQMQDAPFAGDVVNSYNDGPPSPGAPYASFYELETSSPAAELPAGGSITHIHRTYHFAGTVADLNDLSMKVLGVDLRTI